MKSKVFCALIWQKNLAICIADARLILHQTLMHFFSFHHAWSHYMRLLAKSFLTCSFAAMMMAAPTLAHSKTLTEDDVVAIVKRVIREQPELIIESLENMKAREMASSQQRQAESLKKYKNELTKDSKSPAIGNPKADVTVVQFFDYHCGYCKRMVPVVEELVKADKNVKVIFKEFPILSEDSGLAARAALAVNKLAPDLYFDYHKKLMQHRGEYNQAVLTRYATDLKINADKFTSEVNAEWVTSTLAEVRKLAQALDIQGTPAMVVGDQVLPGATDIATLKDMVKKARAAK
jgi:protein-disulfide isomerase